MEENREIRETVVTDPDYPRRTKFPPARTDSVVVEAWFDELHGQQPTLWLESKDGGQVCVPHDRMETLKRLIRRGRNP